jgi:hypothetical protein
VQQAAQKYGRIIAEGDQQTAAGHQARQQLVDDIIKSGMAAGDSTKQIAAMITKVLGIPPKEALTIVMTGEGQYHISGGVGGGSPQPGKTQKQGSPPAATSPRAPRPLLMTCWPGCPGAN